MADKKVNEVPETTNNNDIEAKDGYKRAIIGLVLLAVFGSIVFSTYVMWTGTDNIVYKYAVAPQALFAAFIAFVAFSKILK